MDRKAAHRFCQPVAQILPPRLPARCTSTMKRVVSSTSVAMAERLPFPMITSPSQCPGTDLPTTSAGLSRILTMSGKRLVRCSFRRYSRVHGQIQASAPVQSLIDGLRTDVHFRLAREIGA